MNMCDKFARENPSFSSTLLDSIYRSIDESSSSSSSKSKSNTSKPNQNLIFYKETTLKKKKKQTNCSTNEFCIDPMLLNSSSTSSDSSSGGGFSISSSDSDSTSSKSRPKAKPIRTHQVVERNNLHGGCTSSAKSKALKIYSEFKKVKQPISPGAKLTRFINSLFNSKTTKKTTKYDDKITCSSASSFSRSCLSMRTKSSTRTRTTTTTTQRPVRFCLDDEDDSMSRPCEQIKIAKRGHVECHTSNELDYNVLLNNYRKTKNEAVASVVVAVDEYDNDGDDYDDDDVASYASSDLFELDHLRAIGNEMYLEELPVYETTRFNTNRAIASGLIV